MSKKLNNLKWESVALEGFPASMSDKFQGFVGLEECTNYGLDKEVKSRKKVKHSSYCYFHRYCNLYLACKFQYICFEVSKTTFY